MSNTYSNAMRNLVISKNYFNSYQQIRWFARWNHRTPVRVIEAEDYDESTESRYIKRKKRPEKLETKSLLSAPNKINWKQPTSASDILKNANKIEKPLEYKIKSAQKPLTISKSNLSKNAEVDMLETIIDEEGNFIYSKMDNNDSRVTSILTDIKSKKEKEKKDLVLLEGKRLIKDALDAGCHLEYILFSRLKEVEYLRTSLPKIGARLYKMPYNEMQMWSGLTTNPGIMGIFKIPDTEIYTPSPDTLPITIICDNIREAGNLGAVLRTSSGVGCKQIILTPGCVNVWDSKVLRTACGAHFKLKIKRKLEWEKIKELIYPNSTIYIADNNTMTSNSTSLEQSLIELVESVPVLPYYGVDFNTSAHIVLIIGGETEGISEQSYRLAAETKGVRLNVPLTNNIDSLNTGTALGIIAFEIKRQMLRSTQTN